MRTIVYVDGFNLYYRALRRRPEYKWVNPLLLARQILRPENDVLHVNYYTARVSARTDPDAPKRQNTYLDALKTVPEIELVFGNFRADKKWAALAPMPNGSKPPFQPWPSVVKIIKTEEKGSDVNLGSHLVRDAFQNRFDVAAIITNDTDLVEPMRIAVKDCSKIVGVLCPADHIASEIEAVASFHRFINVGHLARSQFPDPVPRRTAPSIHKPSAWVSSST